MYRKKYATPSITKNIFFLKYYFKVSLDFNKNRCVFIFIIYIDGESIMSYIISMLRRCLRDFCFCIIH